MVLRGSWDKFQNFLSRDEKKVEQMNEISGKKRNKKNWNIYELADSCYRHRVWLFSEGNAIFVHDCVFWVDR